MTVPPNPESSRASKRGVSDGSPPARAEPAAASVPEDVASERAARIHTTHADGGLITSISRRAMATDFVVLLPAHQAGAVEIVVAALEEVEAIERALTIYRDDSEISEINREAHHHPVQLSKATFALLERALRWSELTGGAFDVTAGPLVEAWGFSRRSGSKPTQAEIDHAAALVGFQDVQLDAERLTVRLGCPGMAINLGAIGKGDALDRVAAELKQNGVRDFLIHGGNSSVLAAGTQSRDHDYGWAVGLAHPTKPRRRLGGLWLKDQSLATSGSGKQFFHHRGRRYGHVIDPRTGYPAGDLLSLTVLMESAADADACATGLFVLGQKATLEFEVAGEIVPMIRIAQGSRQDQVRVDWQGDIAWVDPPVDESSSQS